MNKARGEGERGKKKKRRRRKKGGKMRIKE